MEKANLFCDLSNFFVANGNKLFKLTVRFWDSRFGSILYTEKGHCLYSERGN